MKRRAITYKHAHGNDTYSFHLYCGHIVVKQYKEDALVPWKTMTCHECK